MNFQHSPVFLHECIDNLNINPDGVYVDCTLGGAGHSVEIVKRLSAKGRLIGIDRDENAIKKSQSVLADYSNIVTYVNRNYSDFCEILDDLGIPSVDGVLLDLGVSSHQLDEPERGFSYMHDAKLDMRMDARQNLTASDVVNGYSESELCRVILSYGEERWAKRIAEFIGIERRKRKIETTFELVSIIKMAVPKSVRQDGPHPAKRTFQAIRIEVNNELDSLYQTLHNIANRLSVGGRLAVISFHSLEDRIVKTCFKYLESDCECPKDFPVCVCNKEKLVSIVTRKPILPQAEEIAANNRAHSAKLRVAQRI